MRSGRRRTEAGLKPLVSRRNAALRPRSSMVVSVAGLRPRLASKKRTRAWRTNSTWGTVVFQPGHQRDARRGLEEERPLLSWTVEHPLTRRARVSGAPGKGALRLRSGQALSLPVPQYNAQGMSEAQSYGE